MTTRPSIEVAVIMRRERIDNRWQPWRWVLADVVPHEPAFGSEPRMLFKSDDEERWLHPGFKVELFRDDAEGYYLNVTTPAPVLVRAVAHGGRSHRERRAAGPPDDGVAELPRRRPLAGCAGDGGAGARARRRWSNGCAHSSTSTT